MKTPESGKRPLSGEEAPARLLARRLITRRRSEQAGAETPARAASSASNYLYRELSRWVGSDGCHALFARALAEARGEHPALGQIQLRSRSDPYIEGIAEAIIAHGDAATSEALESMLARLVELLGRLIGDDMAMNLIERSLAVTETGNAGPPGRREEA